MALRFESLFIDIWNVFLRTKIAHFQQGVFWLKIFKCLFDLSTNIQLVSFKNTHFNVQLDSNDTQLTTNKIPFIRLKVFKKNNTFLSFHQFYREYGERKATIVDNVDDGSKKNEEHSRHFKNLSLYPLKWIMIAISYFSTFESRFAQTLSNLSFILSICEGLIR